MAHNGSETKQHIAAQLKGILLALRAHKRRELAGIVEWDDIEGKPATYPPLEHRHSVADIDGALTREQMAYALAEMLRWDNIRGKPLVFDAAPHEHRQYAERGHAHPEYARTNHTHSEYAPRDHGHSWQAIDLPDDLVALIGVLEGGKPGQVLTRTQSGFVWQYPPVGVNNTHHYHTTGTAEPEPTEPEPTLINALLVEPGVPLLADDSTYIQYESE